MGIWWILCLKITTKYKAAFISRLAWWCHMDAHTNVDEHTHTYMLTGSLGGWSSCEYQFFKLFCIAWVIFASIYCFNNHSK